jgi:hypothetical protein
MTIPTQGHIILRVSLITCGLIGSGQAFAQNAGNLWLNTGAYSHHFDQGLNLRDRNLGLGLEYRYSADAAWTAGMYQNSDWQNSRYLGWYWQPWLLRRWGSLADAGAVRAGAVFGVFDGYPKANNGGLLPGLIPSLSAETQRIGVNLFFVPGYKEKLHASVSIQLKYKLSNSD